jgi:hypothetical protein
MEESGAEVLAVVDNTPALAVYRNAGFADTDRRLLTLQMSDPTHVE